MRTIWIIIPDKRTDNFLSHYTLYCFLSQRKKKKKKIDTLPKVLYLSYFSLSIVSSFLYFFHFSGGVKYSDLNAEEGKFTSTFHFLPFFSSFSLASVSNTRIRFNLPPHFKSAFHVLCVIHAFPFLEFRYYVCLGSSLRHW